MAFIVIVSMGCISLPAQEYKYELGGALGATYYIGDAVRRGPLGTYAVGVSGLVRYNLNFRWVLSTALAYDGLRGDTRFADNAFPQGRSARFRTHTLQWRVGGEFNFRPLSNKYRYLQTSSWSPYLSGGALIALGWGEYSSTLAPGVYAALGIKYMVSSRITLSAEWRSQYYLSDRLDALGKDSDWLADPFALNRAGIKGGDASGQFSLGLTYHIGLRNKSICYTSVATK